MNKFKKVLAVLLALSAIGGGVGMTANADSIENAEILTQAENLVQSGKFSQGEYELLSEQLENLALAQTTYYMPRYSDYTTASISPTTHFLAPIVATNTSLDSGSVYFYLNLNVLPANATDSSRLTLGRNYISGGYSLGNISATSYYNSAKTMGVPFNTPNVVNAPSYGELFTYNLGEFGSSTTITNENLLNRYTSNTPSLINPSLTLYTSIGYTAQKCVYSAGDVNRDGQITQADYDRLLAYLVDNTVPNPSSSSQGYDVVAFELAGDCYADGVIDVADALTLLQYINGTVTSLPVTP